MASFFAFGLELIWFMTSGMTLSLARMSGSAIWFPKT